MNFTQEQLTKAKAAKSVEELLALAKENGLELTEEEAKNYFEQWHKEGELADEELNNVAGGCGSPDRYYSNHPCPDPDDFEPLDGLDYSEKRCGKCKHFARDNSDPWYGYCLA